MRDFIRNLVDKARNILARGCVGERHPLTHTAWELIPFSFEADWLSAGNPTGIFPHTAACYCYYCRTKDLWEHGIDPMTYDRGFH